MNMINFTKSDLKYIENRINEDIEILKVENPIGIQQYAKEQLSEYECNTISLNELKYNLQFANENNKINKQIENYCIWVMGMWMELRFQTEVDELDAPYIDDGYRSIYSKIIKDKYNNYRYYGDGIMFYNVD